MRIFAITIVLAGVLHAQEAELRELQKLKNKLDVLKTAQDEMTATIKRWKHDGDFPDLIKLYEEQAKARGWIIKQQEDAIKSGQSAK